MIENNCSCSVLSNKIDKSIIRRYDNNKGRKRSGLDKRKLQAVEKAIESLAPQGFLPVRRAPLVRAPASHAGGRWFESISLHHQAEPKKISARKAQKFQRLPDFFAPIFRSVTKRCQNGLWQIRWTCTFTHGILSRFSEDFSEKWLFFVLGKV